MAHQRFLFVCLGNICRSPLAEAIFIHRAREQDLLESMRIDSAGIGHWHVGGRADPRTIEVGRLHGIEVPSIARQVQAADFESFDLLLAMDRENRRDLLALGCEPSRIRLMRSFDPTLAETHERKLDVPDPYLGGPEGFEEIYHMLQRACEGLLQEVSS